MNINKKKWTTYFLFAIGVATLMELWASFDNSDSTVPLTYLIVDYIPGWISLPIISLFALWLVKHFYTKYKEKDKKKEKK